MDDVVEYKKYYCSNGHCLGYWDPLMGEDEPPTKCEICGSTKIFVDYVKDGEDELCGPMIGFDMVTCPECSGKGEVPRPHHKETPCDCGGKHRVCVKCFGTGTVSDVDTLDQEECPLCYGRQKCPVEKFDVSALLRKHVTDKAIKEKMKA